MVKPHNRFALCLLAILLAAAVVAVDSRAEVSANDDDGVNLLIVGITEGPDPIPQVIWEPVREDVDPELFLNPEGAPRGDGRPDSAFDPFSFVPHVVWSFHAGTDHDIAYSTWNGDGWTEVEFLTAAVSDDLDPRIFLVPDGAAHVVWWEGGTETVWMRSRPAGSSTWDNKEAATGVLDTGRRPSVVVSDGTLRVGYERDASPTGQEVVVATRIADGVYDREVIAVSQSAEPLNVILHEEQGILWVDWRHSDTEFAYSVFDGGQWSELKTVPWTDNSWALAEEARLVLRGIVISAD